MPQVRVCVVTTDLDADQAYERISDLAQYPRYTPAVREVELRAPEPDGTLVSEWTVHFRNGLLRWTERDTFDRAARTIAFTQLDGDFQTFEGSWAVEQTRLGTRVSFDAAFDLGIPTLAEIIDPIAQSTLRRNIVMILRGLLGEVEEEPELESVGAAND